MWPAKFNLIKMIQNDTEKGGDAGDIFIAAKNIDGNGKITANGGDGSVGGKGGTIKIISENNQFAGEISAHGGRSSDKFKMKKSKIDWEKWGTIGTYIGIGIAILLAIVGWIYFAPLAVEQNNSAPCSINTNNQNGGTNTVNCKSQERIVDENLKLFLNTKYSKDKPLGISFNESSKESRNFAELIRQFLISDGWSVSYFMSAIQGCKSSNGLCFFPDGIYITGI